MKCVLASLLALFATFFLQAQPVIKSVSPLSGRPGTVVKISGSKFGKTGDSIYVSFGAIRAKILSVSDTVLQVQAPLAANYAPITVSSKYRTAQSSFAFSIIKDSVIYMPAHANTFLPKQDFPVGFIPYSLSLADFDIDGKPDVLVSGASSRAKIFTNTSYPGGVAFYKQSYVTASSPEVSASVAGDFNGDGKPDIALAAISSKKIDLFFSDSRYPGDTPQFKAAVTRSVSAGGYNLAAGDLNGDGLTDFALAQYDKNRIQFLVNQAIFPVSSYDTSSQPVNQAPFDIAIQDLDGDQKPELIVGCPSFNSVFIYALQGTGKNITLQFKTSIFIERLSKFVIGDLNGDGKPEIVAVTEFENGRVIIQENQSGNGQFSFRGYYHYQTNTKSVNLAIGDVDGDDFVDIVTVNRDNNSITILSNNFSDEHFINFRQPITIAAGSAPIAIRIGDLDGDAKPELTVANSGDNSISVFRNIHNGKSNPGIYNANPMSGARDSIIKIWGAGLIGVNAVKFGGIPAKSFRIESDSLISVTLGVGNTGFISVQSSGMADSLPGFLYTGPQITAFHPKTAVKGTRVTVYGKNLGTTSEISFGNIQAESFQVLSNDSLLAVVGDAATGDIAIRNAFGTAEKTGFVFGKPRIYGFLPDSARVGEMVSLFGENFHPVPDSNIVRFGAVHAKVVSASKNNLVVVAPAGTSYAPVTVTVSGLTADFYKSFYTIYDNSNPNLKTESFAKAFELSVPDQNEVIISDDINNDGKPDLLVGGTAYQGVGVFLNASTTDSINFLFAENSIFGSIKNIFTADLNGDGLKDIISVEKSGVYEDLVVFLNKSYDNIDLFSSIPFGYPLPAESIVNVGDVNIDGRPDLLYIDRRNKTLSILLNETVPGKNIRFALPVNIGLNGDPKDLQIADLNGDQKPEILVSFYANNDLAIFKNNSVDGSLNLGAAQRVPIGYYFTKFTCVDIDKDYKTDLIVTDTMRTRAILFHNQSSSETFWFSPKKTFWVTNSGAVTGDLNGDAEPDVLFAPVSGGAITVYQNRGYHEENKFTDSVFLHGAQYVSKLVVGDFNGDGRSDIAGMDRVNKKVTILKNILLKTSPVITSVSPRETVVGGEVTIRGNDLINISDLHFGGKPAKRFSVISSSEIRAIVDSGNSGLVKLFARFDTVTYDGIRVMPTITIKDSQHLCSDGYMLLASSLNAKNQWYRNGELITGATGQFYNATLSGVYAVSARFDTITTFSSNNIQVTILQQQKPVLKMNNNMELYHTLNGRSEWYLNDTIIPGATTASFKPQRDGQYAVRVSSGGCTSDSSEAYVFKKTNSIQISENEHLNFFPNPATHYVRLVWEVVGNPPMEIMVTDQNGTVVKRLHNIKSGYAMSIAGIKKGSYYLRIYNPFLSINKTTTLLIQ